jgi:hypothetical protein
MSRKIILSAALLLVPTLASADNIGQCGWGTRIFDGNSGLAPQVLAVTTNGTSGNQTFGMSSATSGCTRDGVVKSAWKSFAYIETNKNKLARDMSRGNGEALESLASLMGIDGADKDQFFASAKSNFQSVFPNTDASTESIVAAINSSVLTTPELAKYRIAG